MSVAQWWSERPGVERFDLSTRAPLYLASALEPVAMLLLIIEQERLRPWGVTLLLAVTVAHATACLLVLRAALGYALGGPGPGIRLLGTAIGLTAAGLAAGPAAFPTYGRLLGMNGFPIGLAVTVLFCGALTAALTPMLSGRQLVAVVILPAVVLGVLHLVLAAPQDRTPWTLNYLLIVGTLVLIFRSSVWVLGLVWEIDRARDVQARLAVAEERLRSPGTCRRARTQPHPDRRPQRAGRLARPSPPRRGRHPHARCPPNRPGLDAGGARRRRRAADHGPRR